MNATEQHLSLELVKTGMLLARDLLDAKGQVLMGRDTELSGAGIAALHRRDITKIWVFVAGTQMAEIPAQDPTAQPPQKDRLVRLFRHVGENKEGLYLMNLMARYRGIDLS